MARKRLESSIQGATLQQALMLWGVVGIKVWNANWPDVIFLYPGGHHILMEFKREGEVPRPEQWIVINRLRYQGHIVYWADNVEEALYMIHEHL